MMKTNHKNLGAAVTTSQDTTPKVVRLLFIDNLRIFLTVLVIAHHLMIIYASTGGWIFYEGRQDDITDAIGGWFCAVNQSYFMGLFLFISAYFVPGAYDRKGPGKFLADRLVRLGIPLVIYSWLIRPLYLFFVILPDTDLNFWDWYINKYFQVYGIIGGGPLWFIEVLLIFSAIYILWRLVKGSQPVKSLPETRFPSNGLIALFAMLLGGCTFMVRLVSPVNDTFVPFNLQFANFCQYIALFILGLVAYRRNWLISLPDSVGKLWLGIGGLLILLYGPLAIIGGALKDVEPFMGGWHWQSLLFATWDAFMCLSMCIGLVYLFRRRLNRQGPLAYELSRGAYATYLIHEPVITSLAMLTIGIFIYPLLKFFLACIIFIPICFGLGSLVRRLPYFDRVL